MTNIQNYLQELKTALVESDPATVQDALADAEEYLSNAIEAICEKSPQLDEAAALQIAIEQYGSPQDTAIAYLEAVQRLSPSLEKNKPRTSRSIFGRFFAIYVDSIAWGSMLYILISMITGIVYFTWTVAGLSFSISFLIFIFGLFFLLFYLYSLRGIALLEGRIVEALLGIRMPRRPLFKPRGQKWTEQLRMLLKEKHTWLTLIYTVLQMPLGVIYFSVLVTFIATSLSLIVVPVLQYVLRMPVVTFPSFNGFFPLWSMPVFVLGGVLLLTATFHTCKGLGILHSKWAKLMLVSE